MEEQKNKDTKNSETKETKVSETAKKSCRTCKAIEGKKKLGIGLLALVLIVSALFFLQKNNIEGEGEKDSLVKSAISKIGLWGNENNTGTEDGKVLSAEDEVAKNKIEAFINENLMSSGATVTIKDFAFSKEDRLYKMTVDVGNGQEIESCLTKDEKLFFPQVIDIEKMKQEKLEAEEKAKAEKEKELAEMGKSDKPKVELFVMSHCPFGTQAEKGMLPVLKALGDKIDFELKFCTYAMHGEKELQEQLNQYCIQKESPEKLNDYLNCFLEEDEDDEEDEKKRVRECIANVGISSSKLASCVAATDKEYKVMENFKNKDTWFNGRFPIFDVHKEDNEKYGITGSPGLVINGKKVSSERDSKSLLEAICAGFNDRPEECDADLSSVTPSAGFGFSEAGSGSGGSCS